MKKSYVPKTLGEYISESNSIPLMRKYGERPAIVAGANAPIRNRVISYVAESGSVSKRDLKQYIMGLREGGTTVAAANMFMKRNAKYFVTENRNGETFFKLSNLGQRLANQFVPKGVTDVSEAVKHARKKFSSLVESTSRRRRINEEDEMLEQEDDIEMPPMGDEGDVEAVEIEDVGPAKKVEFDRDLDTEDEDFDEDEVKTSQFEYKEDDEKITLTYYKHQEDEDDDEDFEERDFDEDEDAFDEDDEDEDFDEDDELEDRPVDDDREFDFKDKGRPGILGMDESINEDYEFEDEDEDFEDEDDDFDDDELSDYEWEVSRFITSKFEDDDIEYDDDNLGDALRDKADFLRQQMRNGVDPMDCAADLMEDGEFMEQITFDDEWDDDYDPRAFESAQFPTHKLTGIKKSKLANRLGKEYHNLLDDNEDKDDKEFKDLLIKAKAGKKLHEKSASRLAGRYGKEYHNLLDDNDEDDPRFDDLEDELTEREQRIAKMKRIMESLRKRRLNEADEEDELKDEDLDSLDLDAEVEDEGNAEDTDLDMEDEVDTDEVEKVEITEFIITVDNVDSAIEELAELGVTAERVPIEEPEEEVAPEVDEEPAEEEAPEEEAVEAPEDEAEVAPEVTQEAFRKFVMGVLNEEEEEEAATAEEGTSDELGLGDQGEDALDLDDAGDEEENLEPTAEFEENKIKVDAADWDTLKGWLEEKGVDVKEMFGGDIETEEFDDEEDAENATATTTEVSDDEIDFTGIGDDDDTKVDVKDKKVEEAFYPHAAESRIKDYYDHLKYNAIEPEEFDDEDEVYSFVWDTAVTLKRNESGEYVIDGESDPETVQFIETIEDSGAEYEVINPVGPGGGLPEIRYTGTKQQLIPVMVELTASLYSAEEIAEMIKDWDGDERELIEILG